MATDIAFAAGIVSLAGTRVPSAAKVFLLSLAIVDDLGAIIVIAVFYSHGRAPEWFGVALLALAAAVVLRRVHVRSVLPYVLLDILCGSGCTRRPSIRPSPECCSPSSPPPAPAVPAVKAT